MGRCPPRLLGLVLLACSGGSTLIHRSIYQAARHGPAQVAEFGLCLLTFILAAAGIMLLVHGARLFGPVVPVPADEALPARDAFLARLEAPITPQGRAFDTRRGALIMQAHHRLNRSRPSRTMIGARPGRLQQTAFDWTTTPRR